MQDEVSGGMEFRKAPWERQQASRPWRRSGGVGLPGTRPGRARSTRERACVLWLCSWKGDGVLWVLSPGP